MPFSTSKLALVKNIVLNNLADSIHYSVLQPCMQYLPIEDSLICYRRALCHCVVWGQPIHQVTAANPSWIKAYSEFDKIHKNIIYYYLDEHSALQLHSYKSNYQFMSMGVERIIDLDSAVSALVEDNGELKSALVEVKNLEMKLTEFLPLELSSLDKAELNQVLSQGSVSRSFETEFSSAHRQLDLNDNAGARYFKAVSSIGLLGLVVIDPYRTKQKKKAYLLSVVRLKSSAPSATYYFLVDALSEILKRELVCELSLGLNPMECCLTHPELKQSKQLYQSAAKLNVSRYALFTSAELEQAKITLSNRLMPRYCAFKSYNLSLAKIALAKVLGFPVLRSSLKLLFAKK